MGLRTVRVAEAMEAVFAKAEEVVSSYFRTREDHPERGVADGVAVEKSWHLSWFCHQLSHLQIAPLQPAYPAAFG